MSLPFALPDWLPWWALLIAVVPVFIYLLLFLMMPLNVFGVKDRLDLLDARMDEIQSEIRQLTLRLAAAEPPDPDEFYTPPRPSAPPRQQERPLREEPRFDRPR